MTPEERNLRNDRGGSRCGACYWALYDGDYCQNPDCRDPNARIWNRIIGLSNGEAQILIKAKLDSTPENSPPTT